MVCWGFLRTCAMWWDKSSAKISYCICSRGPQDCHNRKIRMRKHRGSKRHLNPLPILQQTSPDVTDISAKAGVVLLILYFTSSAAQARTVATPASIPNTRRPRKCPGHVGNLTLVSDTKAAQLASAFRLRCRTFQLFHPTAAWFVLWAEHQEFQVSKPSDLKYKACFVSSR